MIPHGVGTLDLQGVHRVYVTKFGAPRPGGTGPMRLDFAVAKEHLAIAGRTDWYQIRHRGQPVPIYRLTIHNI